MRLSLCIDTRCETRKAAVARALLRTTARQCAELLSVCRLSGRRVSASVAVVRFAGTTAVAPETAVMEGEQGLPRLLRALEAVERMEPDGVPPPAPAALFGCDRMSCVRPLLVACGGAAGGAERDVCLFATSYVPCAELFSSLAHVGSVPLSYTLHCMAVDGDALGVTTASLSSQGTLYCCSPDPIDMRATLQLALGPALLSGDGRRAAMAFATSALPCVPVSLCFGTGVVLPCTAQRSYMGPLLRCCTTDAFPHVQEEKPSLIFQGPAPVRLSHSGFELARFGEQAESATLVLEAIVPPENVDEMALYDNTWILTARRDSDGGGTSPESVFDAAFSQFCEDVLVLRCGSGGAALSAPHHMALQRTCFIAHFVDRARLVLQQMVPLELRRFMHVARLLRATEADAATVARLRALREEMVGRSADPAFSLDGILQGGICLLAAQLRPEKEYSLHLAKLFR